MRLHLLRGFVATWSSEEQIVTPTDLRSWTGIANSREVAGHHLSFLKKSRNNSIGTFIAGEYDSFLLN